MLLIGRIVIILFALGLAYMAAGIAFAIGMVAPDIGVMDYDPIERWFVFGIGFITTSIAVGIAILPTFLLVAVAEGLRLRSFLFYGVCGGLIGAMVYFGTDTSMIMENSTDITPICSRCSLRPRPALSAGSSTGSSPGAMPGGGWITRRASYCGRTKAALQTRP